MRLASHPHWLIHVQIIKDCNLIFTCFQCWSSSCFLSSSCLHFCNFTLHLQIATFCNFTHLIFNLFHLKIHCIFTQVAFTFATSLTWCFSRFTPESVSPEASLVLMSLEASLTLLFKSFHQHLFNPFHSLDLRSSLSNLQVFCLNFTSHSIQLHLPTVYPAKRLAPMSLEGIVIQVVIALFASYVLPSHARFRVVPIRLSDHTPPCVHRLLRISSSRSGSKPAHISDSRSETRCSSIASVLTSSRFRFTSHVSAVDFVFRSRPEPPLPSWTTQVRV